MTAVGYDNDPRLLAEKAKALAEKNAVKNAKKNAKLSVHNEAAEKKAEVENKLKAEKEDADLKKKEEALIKKEAGKLYRKTCRDVIVFCEQKMPGHPRYDKYLIEEKLKKFQNQEKIDALRSTLEAFGDDTFID